MTDLPVQVTVNTVNARPYLGAMKSLKHFASFDWSAEIDDGHAFLVLNVSARGGHLAAGPEVCRPRSAALLLV